MYIASLAFMPTLFVFFLMPPIYDLHHTTAAITPRNIATEMADGFDSSSGPHPAGSSL
jgi:hypothetical protein